MNKGVIVQLDYDVAHILKNDGVFVTCPRNISWQIGDVVTLPSRRSSLKVIAASCVLFISLLVSGVIGVYHIPSTYIEISINPSIQLTLNRFERVLNVTGLNDDGDNLLQGTSYKNSTLFEACAWLFSRLENNGYLNDATIQLIIANNSQKTIDRIEESLRSVTEKYSQAGNARVSIKRYANDEYTSLLHPLPIMEIPNAQTQAPSTEQTEVLTENASILPSSETLPPPSETSPPKETPPPLSETAPPEETPQSDDEPSLPPSNTPSPNMPSHGNWQNGNWHRGNWQNGWWDWDCGW